MFALLQGEESRRRVMSIKTSLHSSSNRLALANNTTNGGCKGRGRRGGDQGGQTGSR